MTLRLREPYHCTVAVSYSASNLRSSLSGEAGIISRIPRCYFPAARLLISNAEPQGIARPLVRLVKSLLEPVNHRFCGLNLFAVLFKPRHPGVDEFVAKQLIGSERQQHLKFLNGQL